MIIVVSPQPGPPHCASALWDFATGCRLVPFNISAPPFYSRCFDLGFFRCTFGHYHIVSQCPALTLPLSLPCLSTILALLASFFFSISFLPCPISHFWILPSPYLLSWRRMRGLDHLGGVRPANFLLTLGCRCYTSTLISLVMNQSKNKY